MSINDFFFRHRLTFGLIIFYFIPVLLLQAGLFDRRLHQPMALALENRGGAEAIWPHQSSDLQPDSDLRFGSLENGFRYVLRYNSKPKDRVSIHLNVQAGSLNEKENEQGTAHFLEHMMFCGTTHFEPGELVEYFQSIGMKFGPDANARTGFDQTTYDILLPAGDRHHIEKALQVMKDFAQGALLLPEEIDQERNVILAEKRTRDSASYRTFESKLIFEFPESKISRRLPIGKENVIRTMDRDTLKLFYEAWYKPERMILVMAGDFDVHTTETLIRDAFSSLVDRSSAKNDSDLGNIAHTGLKPFYHYENEVGSTTVNIEVIRKRKDRPDTFEHKKDRLIQQLADRIMQHRLNALLKKPDTPFTSAGIHTGTFLKQVEYAEISTQCSPDNWEKALSSLEQALRRALVYGFTRAECERAKKEMLADLEQNVKTADTRDSRNLARQILSSINQNRVMMSPLQMKQRFASVIASISREDLKESFCKTWQDDHRLILVTGNAEVAASSTSPEDRILEIYKRSLSMSVSPPTEKKAVSFPYLELPEKRGKIARRSTVTDLDIVQIDYENGVRLNLKKTDFKAGEVEIAMSFGRGACSQPLDKSGLYQLARDVVNESGLGSLTRDDLNRALAGKKTFAYFEIQEDRFRFRAKTIPEEIDLACQLLYTHLVDPGFRKEAFSLVGKRFDQTYQSLNHSIEGAMKLHGKRFFAGGDTRFGLPTRDRFNRLSLEDVISWLSPSFISSPVEISVVGDFDTADVVNSVSKSLGALDNRSAAKADDRMSSPVFPEGNELKLRIESKVPKGLVVVAYATDDIWDIHLTRRLSVLSQVLSERLRKQIREKIGASYSPYAYHHPSRAYQDYGALYAHIETDPSLTRKVVLEVKELSGRLAASGIGKEELRLSLDPILTGIKDSRTKNDYWLNTVLDGSRNHPRQLDWAGSIVHDYASITHEEISRLAADYLAPEKAAALIISSENSGHPEESP
ncbi:MAG: insulinase family protein [Desulfobacterales bacterium]